MISRLELLYGKYDYFPVNYRSAHYASHPLTETMDCSIYVFVHQHNSQTHKPAAPFPASWCLSETICFLSTHLGAISPPLSTLQSSTFKLQRPPGPVPSTLHPPQAEDSNRRCSAGIHLGRSFWSPVTNKDNTFPACNALSLTPIRADLFFFYLNFLSSIFTHLPHLVKKTKT